MEHLEPLQRQLFGQGRVLALSDDARYIARLDRLALEKMQQRLPLLMKKRKFSQRKLAETSRVPINTVRETIRGRGKPSIGKVLAYAEALGVSVDALFGETTVEKLVRDLRDGADSAPSGKGESGDPTQGVVG